MIVKRWTIGLGCHNSAPCKENAAQGWVSTLVRFASYHWQPPAYPGCTCTLSYALSVPWLPGNRWPMGQRAKRWIALLDSRVCRVCRANEAQGWIPETALFQSGHSCPKAHDNCRCAIEYGPPPKLRTP